MSQVAAEFGAAVVATGSILAAPFTGGASLLGLTVAAGLMGVAQSYKEQAQTQANVGDFNTSTTIPTGGAATFGGVDTSKPPAVQATSEAGIAKERYAEAETQIGSMQAQLGQAVLGEKVSETTAEGRITASAAARGLKLSGSPLMQLIAQQQAGQQAISYTQAQGTAAIQGAQLGVQAYYDAANLKGKEELQYASQEVSNAWLSAFGSAINVGEDILKLL